MFEIDRIAQPHPHRGGDFHRVSAPFIARLTLIRHLRLAPSRPLIRVGRFVGSTWRFPPSPSPTCDASRLLNTLVPFFSGHFIFLFHTCWCLSVIREFISLRWRRFKKSAHKFQMALPQVPTRSSRKPTTVKLFGKCIPVDQRATTITGKSCQPP